MKNNLFNSDAVKEKFDAYPTHVRQKLLLIRKIIFDTARAINVVGPIEETLKWGEPSYLTTETKSGSTIRIDFKDKNPNQIAIYFHCRTTLVDGFKERFGSLFQYGGNRCIYFDLEDNIPIDELSDCIAMALTYHIKN